MNRIRTLIIDDEKLARDLIRNFLESIPEIEIIGECQDGFEGIKAIQEKTPDLIFLDVQMPKLTGFEMLELIENPPVVVFSTAYNEFALKAFEMNAVDYLLKPFNKERFLQALSKAQEKLKSRSEHQESIREIVNTPNSYKLERIVVKTGSKIKVIPVNQVIYLEAQDDYVMIYTPEGKFLKQQTMKYFEQSLDSSKFVRIHRSYLVSIDQISQLEAYEKDSHQLVLKNNSKLPVSRSGYGILKKTLDF